MIAGHLEPRHDILRDDEQGAKGLTEKAEAEKRRRKKWKPEKRQKMMSQ
ncbi:hypothetical protein WJ0W_003234 [Paenibacillus melissococcoides]|uniref:Uncharacterized protein n=1 Tax=Paenibacillus melissococcoides TaxID=2912268 RepID=A0ABM9G2V7_9BACL|nr:MULTISPECIES: hypothetical protein [Paenibacillus]CAH8245999.1 hypothetical protein WJ0W_003234 [Paenibacillus melissococcoides]CAH8712672.1 hypothetical protein WDD9_003314 [Paenibacillus melissococcoides]CAH8713444.1 hypothetical protein HTL2_003617 [Paenibacillus melissococcoides]